MFHIISPVDCCREMKDVIEMCVVNAVARKQKMHARDDLPSVPRSLFDCPQTIAQRLERDGRLLKPNLYKPLKGQLQLVAGMVRTPLEPVQDHPEWLIHEDWALLQVCFIK